MGVRLVAPNDRFCGESTKSKTLSCLRSPAHPLYRAVDATVAAAGAPNDVWTADFKGWFRTADGTRCDPLTVADACSRFTGSGASGRLDDVHGIGARAERYDASTQAATVVVRLKNTGKQTISGPFKIRIISLTSDLAIAEALGSSNGLTGAGTIWDVLSDVERLEPGAASRAITLTFRLRDVRPLIHGGTTKLMLVDFSARVFGRVVK